MTAASVWSLIIPATEGCETMGAFAFLPCSIGMAFGCLFMIILGRIAEGEVNAQRDIIQPDNHHTILAVTIHNIPEGMAVGCVYASAIESSDKHLFAAAFILALGIAVQNIPEGAVISMPVYASGKSKVKAFLAGTVSGIVEPLGALSALFMAKTVGVLLPYFLGFAAGAMLFVVTQELLPAIKYKGKFPLTGVGFILGFMIMMSLDVALS